MMQRIDRNKKVYIYGAGIVAQAVIIVLKEMKIEIQGCVVTNIGVNVSQIDNIPVFSLDFVAEDLRNAIVLIAVRDRYVDDISKELQGRDINNIEVIDFYECINILEKKWIKESDNRARTFIEHIEKEELSDEEYLMFLSKQLKEDYISFEVNFADHCNLNCQCCNHFSPLAEQKFIDKHQYEKDLIQIKTIFGTKIGSLMLLGGEPLLNPEIVDLLDITRKYLPQTTLYLFTNGLLFPNMKKEFWDACKRNDISVKVTEYPIKFDYTKWFDFGLKNGIDIVSTENPEKIKSTYRLPLKVDGGLDAYKNYSKCYHANQCVVLREGRLYTCPIAAWVDYLNSYFGTSFPEKDVNSIDIYEQKNAHTVMDYLKNPIKMCEYCDIYHYEYDITWEITKRDKKEWID